MALLQDTTDLFVFDLDGTLMDSGDTIYHAMHKTFEALGFDYFIPRDWLDKRIGAHFQDIFKEFGIVIPDIEQYIATYKPIYFDFIDKTTVYEGVHETLHLLHENGKKIAMLTTKAQDQAEKISAHFGLFDFFHTIIGRTPDRPVKPSPESLIGLYTMFSVTPQATLMIGDTEYDIRCGKNAGTKTCAVTYGYRSVEFLQQEKPDVLINTLPSLLTI